MTRSLIPISLAALLACGGCAVRRGAKPVEATPAGVPKTEAPTAAEPSVAPDGPIAATGSMNSPAVSVPGSPSPAAVGPGPATRKAADMQAPAATASDYVFSAQQAVTARPPVSPTPAASDPEAKASASGETATTPGELQLLVVASASEIATGAIMTVDVMASSSTAVVDAPLHLTFDPNVVEFVDGATGDFLAQGGSSVVFFADGRSRPGDVAIATGRVEREQGARGEGLLCRIRFRGVGSGTTAVVVGQAKAWGARGEELSVFSGGTNVSVN